MERVYFDLATANMLLAKDTKRPVCKEEYFAFDETGYLHIIYKDDKGKTIRDFIIPSDKEPEATQGDIADKLEAQMKADKKKLQMSVAIGGAACICILCFTMALMLWLK